MEYMIGDSVKLISNKKGFIKRMEYFPDQRKISGISSAYTLYTIMDNNIRINLTYEYSHEAFSSRIILTEKYNKYFDTTEEEDDLMEDVRYRNEIMGL